MDYGYKPTTNGRRVLIACMESGERLNLTRVAVGKGLVSESADLANQHTLVDYVADGAIGDRRHENDRLYLTVQYSNQTNRDVPTFYLSEFIVYAMNPDTNQETDLLYATLGDYAQPVPAYVRDMPASVFNFPLVMVLSDEINVSISAPAGLVTYDELAELQRHIDLTIPRTGWVADTDTPITVTLPLSGRLNGWCLSLPFCRTAPRPLGIASLRTSRGLSPGRFACTRDGFPPPR